MRDTASQMRGMTRRALLTRASLAAGAGLLAACAPQSTREPTGASPTAGAKRGGTLVVGINGTLLGLDPQNHTGGLNESMMLQMFEGPTRYVNGERTWEPAFAERTELSPDGLTLTVRIKPNITFHDGTPLDAAAYKFTIERQAYENNPYHKGGAFARWKEIAGGYPGALEGLDIVDDRTLRMRWQKGRPFILDNFSENWWAAISPEAIKRDPENLGKNPVGAGSGPFMFDQWVPDQQLAFKRFDKYWESGRPFVDRLVVRFIQETGARVLSLKTGEVHIIQVRGKEITDLQQDPTIQIIQGKPTSMSYFGFDHADPVMKKPEVRLAIAHALDREALTRQLYMPGAIVSTSHGLMPGMEGKRQDIQFYGHDLTKAKQLLTAAGYPDGVDITLTFQPFLGVEPDKAVIAQAVQSQLAKIGIRVKLNQIDLATFLKAFFGAPNRKDFPYQFAMLGAGSRGNPIEHLAIWEWVTNYAGHHPEYGRHLDQVRFEPTAEKRKPVVDRMQQMLYDDVAFIPISHTPTTLAARKNVHGLKAPWGDFPFYYKDVWLD